MSCAVTSWRQRKGIVASFRAVLLVCVATLLPSASTRAETRIERFLREQQPTNHREVYQGAVARYRKGQYDQAVTLARYLLEQGKRHYKVYNLLGLASARLGDRAKARRAFHLSLSLKPGNRIARRMIERLGGTGGGSLKPTPTLIEKYLGPLTGEVKKAVRAFYADRYREAEKHVDRALSSAPTDPAALLVKAFLKAEKMRLDEAEKIITDLERRLPKNPAVLVALGEITMAKQQVPQARAYLQRAQAAAPTDPVVLLKYATLLLISNRGVESDRVYAKASAGGALNDRDALLDQASVLNLRGKTDEALLSLERYSNIYGTDSSLQLTKGLILFKQGKKREAVETLQDSYRRNQDRLTNLVTIVRLLNTVDSSWQAIELVDLGAKRFPGHPILASLRNLTVLTSVQDSEMTATLEGPFEVRYPGQLPKDLLQYIVGLFREAYTDLTATMGIRPAYIRLNITLVPNVPAAAYYNFVDDNINAAAVFFMRQDAQGRAFARHIVRHEFVHLLHARLLKKDGLNPAFTIIPLWLAEGMAEYYAGGVDYMRGMGFRREKAFASGELGYEDLNMTLNVNAAQKGNTRDTKGKAYTQAYYMVRHLIGLKPTAKAVSALVDLTIRIIRTGDLASSLHKVYGITVKDFNKHWTALLRKDLGKVTAGK